MSTPFVYRHTIIMRHPTIYLLRTVCRQIVFAVAILALAIAILRVPCLLIAGQADHHSAATVVSSEVSCGSDKDAPGVINHDSCCYCHCAVSALGVVQDAPALIQPLCDRRRLICPMFCQIPEDLVQAPDVPPDQA